MLNTNLKNVLRELNQYNSGIEQNIDEYKTDRKIKLIGIQIDNSNLFKGLFSEDEEAIRERLDLIQRINNQKIEDLNSTSNKLFNEIKYSTHASHKLFYYATIKHFNNNSRIQLRNGEDKNVFYDNNNTRYSFDEKDGITFGSHLTIYKQNKKSESYFIKAHRNYFASNDKITGTTESQFSTTAVFGSSGKRVSLAPNMDKMDIDFKELFVYKCLERLKFGAEINFFINPDLKKALYLKSKDLNSEGKLNRYKTIQELQKQNTVDPIGRPEQQNISHFEAQLTEMDIIARSFLLTDMHNNNIMFKKEGQNYNLKIVDFIVLDKDIIKPKSEERISLLEQAIKLRNESLKTYKKLLSNFPNDKEAIAIINNSSIEPTMNILENLQKRLEECRSNLYILDNISTSFTTADNTLTKYSQREDRNKIITETLKKEINITGKNQKRLAGKEALKLLEKRLDTVSSRLGIKDKLANIMEQAEKDIMNFMQEENNQTTKQSSNSSLLGLTNEQITAKKDDLHKYKEGVLRNLENIMKFIESGKEIEDDQQAF